MPPEIYPRTRPRATVRRAPSEQDIGDTRLRGTEFPGFIEPVHPRDVQPAGCQGTVFLDSHSELRRGVLCGCSGSTVLSCRQAHSRIRISVSRSGKRWGRILCGKRNEYRKGIEREGTRPAPIALCFRRSSSQRRGKELP
jgi:hypothetical protein